MHVLFIIVANRRWKRMFLASKPSMNAQTQLLHPERHKVRFGRSCVYIADFGAICDRTDTPA